MYPPEHWNSECSIKLFYYISCQSAIIPIPGFQFQCPDTLLPLRSMYPCSYMCIHYTYPFSPQESPLPVAPHMFPTWPAKSEMSRKPKRDKSPTPPEGGAFLINKVRETVIELHTKKETVLQDCALPPVNSKTRHCSSTGLYIASTAAACVPKVYWKPLNYKYLHIPDTQLESQRCPL